MTRSVARATGHQAAQDDRQATDPPGLVTAVTRHVALLAAVIATCGSLYMSQVLGWVPCELCWIQRILMYPLAVILTVGILRDDHGIYTYALPLSLLGSGFSLYHYLEVLQVIPPTPCRGGVPCSFDYFSPYLTGPLGFIKIPFLALIAFVIVSVMLGNYALAGAPATPPNALRRSQLSALAIIGVCVLLTVGFALAL